MTTTTKTLKKATPAKKVVSKKPALAKKAVIDATPKMTALEASKIKKLPKTILDGGLTYSLLSRVRNAFSKEARTIHEKGSKMMEMIDGRGSEVQMSDAYIATANSLGGAKYLASVRTHQVRKDLREAGVSIK